MGKAERMSGAFWFLFSVFIGYQSYRLGLGTLRMPGPGFLFFWTAIFIAVLSLIDMGRSLRPTGKEEAKEGIAGRWNVTKVGLVLLSLFLYVVLIEPLGFVPVTLLLFLFLLAVIEKKKWSFAVLVSLVVTILSYLMFETALKSQLPKGLLDSLRF
jgi:putative tricarboxylic transport membrane protein